MIKENLGSGLCLVPLGPSRLTTRALMIVIFLSSFTLLTGCKTIREGETSPTTDVRLENVETGCMTSGEKNPASLTKEDDYYLVTGSLRVSDPCKNLEVEHSRSNGTLTVELRTSDRDGACVMCVGTLDYRLKVRSNAEKLRVRYRNEALLEKPLP